MAQERGIPTTPRKVQKQGSLDCEDTKESIR
jgi:hypothetical protein